MSYEELYMRLTRTGVVAILLGPAFNMGSRRHDGEAMVVGVGSGQYRFACAGEAK